MTVDSIQIREFREGDLDAVIAFSLRAWAPIFDSLREVLGDDIFSACTLTGALGRPRRSGPAV